MKIVKHKLRQLINTMGYELTETGRDTVPFDVFSDLAAAYEYQLNSLTVTGAIPQDDRRLKLLARLRGTLPAEAYIIIQALNTVKSIKGDVCEFGVAQGETSALIANEISGTYKILHLFDSFEGLSQPTEKDLLLDDIFSLGDINSYAGTMAFPESSVRTRLASINFPPERYVVHKGFVEDVFKSDKSLPDTVSFAYVDFDLYQPITEALIFLDQRLTRGGIILVDDYDYFSSGAKTAVDEFINYRDPEQEIYAVHIPDKRLGHCAILTKVGSRDSVE